MLGAAADEAASENSDPEEASVIYELRTYTIVPGRMPDIERRFSQVTLRLFAKHGMQIVGFWRTVENGHPIDELVYILAHLDQAARDASLPPSVTIPNGWPPRRKARRTVPSWHRWKARF